MNRNIDGDVHDVERVINSAMEMQEFIEEKRVNEPTGKFRKNWVKDMNNMIDTYNRTYGKVYNHVR